MDTIIEIIIKYSKEVLFTEGNFKKLMDEHYLDCADEDNVITTKCINEIKSVKNWDNKLYEHFEYRIDTDEEEDLFMYISEMMQYEIDDMIKRTFNPLPLKKEEK